MRCKERGKYEGEGMKQTWKAKGRWTGGEEEEQVWGEYTQNRKEGRFTGKEARKKGDGRECSVKYAWGKKESTADIRENREKI